MKIQGKRFAAIASALALVMSGLLGAQPVSATSTNLGEIRMDLCNVSSTTERPTLSPRIYVGAVGDTFTILNADNTTCVVSDPQGMLNNHDDVSPFSTKTYTVTAINKSFRVQVGTVASMPVFADFWIGQLPYSAAPTLTNGKDLTATAPGAPYSSSKIYACKNAVLNPGSVHVALGGFELLSGGQECVPVYSSASPGSFLASSGSAFDLTNAKLSTGGNNFADYTSAVYSHIIQVSDTFMAVGNGFFYSPSVQASVAAAAPLTATSASVDATGRVITVNMSAGISGTSMQTFALSVDGNLRAPSVGSIMPGATSLTLNLTAQNAVSAGAVVTLAYQGGAGGNQRLRSHLNASAQLADFSGMSVTNNSTVGGSPSPSQVVTTPYTGPIVQAPGALRPVASGARMVLEGSNLTGVSKATIGGKDASAKVNASGDLELTVPAGLPAGRYDLVITSSSGLLTVQDAIVISGSAVVTESVARPSTKLKEDNTVKVWVFDVSGAGKVQIKLNGEEVAWVNTTDPNDRKLTNGYLVRTLTLSKGKNVIEVFVNGTRVDRKAYTNTID